MRRFSCLAAVPVLGMVAIVMGARLDDEEKIPLDKVPKAVMDAIKAKYPNAKLKGASIESEDGKKVYEISLTFKEYNYDVTVDPDGKIQGIEKEIPLKELPAAIKAAVDAKYPKADYKMVEELSKGDGTVHGYECLLVTATGGTVEVVLDTKGKILKEEVKKEKKEKKDK